MTSPRYPMSATRRGSVLTAVVFAAALLVPLVNATPASATPVVSIGDLLVVDRDLSGGGKVIKVDPVTGVQTVLAADGNFKDPFGAALELDGQHLIVADQDAGPGGLGELIRVDLATGAQQIVSAGGMFKSPSDVAVESNGNLIVVDPAALDGNGAVFRVDPITGAQTIVSQFGPAPNNLFHNPRGVTIDKTTGYILVADEHTAGGGGGRVIGVDPITGVQTIVGPQGDFATPLGIALEANGNIVVGDENAYVHASGGVVRVTRPGGVESMVTTDDHLHATSGIAVDPNNGQLFVISQDGFSGDGSYGDPDGGLLRVDPTTGVQSVISSGQFFNDPIEVVGATADIQPPPPPPTCQGATLTIVGTAGNDSITGTKNADVVASLAGADTVAAASGDDLVCGGDDNDTLTGGSGNDRLYGENGVDNLAGSGANDTLDGGDGNDTLKGGAGDDILIGGPGVDTCIGGAGNDTAIDCEIVKTVP